MALYFIEMSLPVAAIPSLAPRPLTKPPWIRVKLPSGDTWKQVEGVLEKHGLHTVCDEARCPNKGTCWGAGTAAFMILGDRCTRSCRFCGVSRGPRGEELRKEEGREIAAAVRELDLRYLVLTSVDREDLPDRGARHFVSCVTAIKTGNPDTKVELLIPDYNAAELAPLAATGPEVMAHNVETVPSLQWVRDPRASFAKSLAALRHAKDLGIGITKTSLLLGLGEQKAEVLAVMDTLREAAVDILVMGQYLRPSPNQIPVAAYISPEQFEAYAEEARNRGFAAVVSAPLARTSYHAYEAWKQALGRRLS
jgi:lipoic acid synthetase